MGRRHPSNREGRWVDPPAGEDEEQSRMAEIKALCEEIRAHWPRHRWRQEEHVVRPKLQEVSSGQLLWSFRE